MFPIIKDIDRVATFKGTVLQREDSGLTAVDLVDVCDEEHSDDQVGE